jgi:hypothetical protein
LSWGADDGDGEGVTGADKVSAAGTMEICA